MKILVVEDVPSIALLVVEYLREAGHTIIGPASTAKQALDLCENQTPDLAVLDICLEDGSSGLDVGKELFLHRGVVTIFASAELKVTRMVEGTGLAFLQKPYRMVDLLLCVAAFEAMQVGPEPWNPAHGSESYHQIEEALAD